MKRVVTSSDELGKEQEETKTNIIVWLHGGI